MGRLKFGFVRQSFRLKRCWAIISSLLFADGAGTDLMCCAEEKGILFSIEHSRQDKINPGCCRSLLFVISRGSFVFWIVMICISGRDHLYFAESLGVSVFASSSYMTETWVQSFPIALVKPTKGSDMH